MTAVVGILNKQAVAIAADSAVTIGGANGRKIFNRANKIFTLSKYHPVGIMLYNSASFLYTPWETIIKVYRKHLKDNSFSSLKQYQEDFIGFLRAKNFYSTEDEQKDFLFEFARTLIDRVVNEVLENNRHLLAAATPENKEEILRLVEEKANKYIHQFEASANYCPDFSDYDFGDFDAFTADFYDNLIDGIFTNNGYLLSADRKNVIKKFIFTYLKTKEAFTNFTGLIFTGFGDDEIYPSLIPINVSLVIGARIRYYVEDNRVVEIRNNNNGAICPFAQTDVINTILTGIDPRLDQIYLKNFEEYFKKYNHAILGLIGATNPVLSAQISGIDIGTLINEYKLKNDETKRTNYINPLMDAVSNLSKEDLAEMAESLIYLTYLKRRITFAEESVGGPVDVAIISKGDGFIWIKRKHYFRPELNQIYINNYLKV